MPAAQPPRGPSRKALLTEVQTLRQRVAALEQEKHDLEIMLEMATDHADDLSKPCKERHDLGNHAGDHDGPRRYQREDCGKSAMIWKPYWS